MERRAEFRGSGGGGPVVTERVARRFRPKLAGPAPCRWTADRLCRIWRPGRAPGPRHPRHAGLALHVRADRPGERARGDCGLSRPSAPDTGSRSFGGRTSLGEAAADLEQCADALGLGRFALIGVSGGGPYAVAAAAAMPDRVALLALVNPVGPIADCHRRIRMSKPHRLIFARLGRSDAACAAFFWSLRSSRAHGTWPRLSRAEAACPTRGPVGARPRRGESQSSGGAARGVEARHRRRASGLAPLLRQMGSCSFAISMSRRCFGRAATTPSSRREPPTILPRPCPIAGSTSSRAPATIGSSRRSSACSTRRAPRSAIPRPAASAP